MPSAALGRSVRHKIHPSDWDWAAFTHGLCGPFCPCFPSCNIRGILISDQVRRTTVAPWSFRKPARKPLRRSGTRALRFVASACIPTGKIQRKRRHVSARTSCNQYSDRTLSLPQHSHHRQAKHNSQNHSNIATPAGHVNHLPREAQDSAQRRRQTTHYSSNSAAVPGFQSSSERLA